VDVPDGLPGPGSRFGFALRRPVLTAALVAAETAGGPEWVELDRFELGSRRFHLIRRDPASSCREP
jgi:hypothetical protein